MVDFKYQLMFTVLSFVIADLTNYEFFTYYQAEKIIGITNNFKIITVIGDKKY